jgi:uncharacterized membrane protein
MSKNLFTESDRQKIIDAIAQAELSSSGEIRVHLEPKCATDPYLRAKEVFEQLGMHATKLRNGVLFYLAYTDKKFAVIGDLGIHEQVSQSFWDSLIQQMQEDFRAGKFTDGLINGILAAGEKLKAYFPLEAGDINELSNELSFGDSDE